MPETFDRETIVAKDSAIPIARIRYFAKADVSVIRRIRYGLLFVMAWWSGPARLGFRKLTEVLAKHDAKGEQEVVVVDTDGCPELYHVSELTGMNEGKGVTALVKDGHVVKAFACYSGQPIFGSLPDTPPPQ
jgi:hypothetical protein